MFNTKPMNGNKNIENIEINNKRHGTGVLTTNEKRGMHSGCVGKTAALLKQSVPGAVGNDARLPSDSQRANEFEQRPTVGVPQ